MFKKILFLILFLTLLAIPVSALNIDAQADTYCNWGNCETRVNLSNYLITTQINIVKGLDLSKSKPALNDKLISFNYRFDNNILVFYGQVKNDVYWTFDLKNGYIIDPFWNYTEAGTEDTITVGITTLGANSDTNKQGYFITMKANASLVSVTKHASDTSSHAWIDFVNDTNIANASFSGNTATFTPNIELTDGVSYHLYTWNSGAGRDAYILNPISIPITTGRDLDIITGQYNDGTWHNDSIGRCIDNITTINASSNVSIWYVNNLFLNGNESNITLNNATEFNVTGITNLTALPVLLYINDTLSANDTDRAENNTYLAQGTYNITGYFGNSSTNETITYWLTMTYTAPGASIGYVFCTDNETLAHINVTNLETDNVISYNDHCVYGCDNVTFACYPAPFI